MMNLPTTRDEEAAYLAMIEDLLPQISTDWQRAHTDLGDTIQARLIPQQAPSPIAIIDPWAHEPDIRFILNAPTMVTFLLELRRRAVEYYRSQQQTEAQAKPYSPAQNCAIWCANAAFQKFMHEVHGLDTPHDPQRIRTKLHGLLSIASRADLDTDPAAAARWHALRADFKTWRDGR